MGRESSKEDNQILEIALNLCWQKVIVFFFFAIIGSPIKGEPSNDFSSSFTGAFMSTRIPNPARRHLVSHPHHFIAADETIPYFVGGKDDTSMLNVGPPSRTRTSINHTNKWFDRDCFLILQIYSHPCPLRLLPLLGFQIIGLLLIIYKKDRVGCLG